jgi:hypothetical protein
VEPATGSILGSWGGGADLRSDGTFLFQGVHPGTYVVSLVEPKKKASVTVTAGEVAELTVQLP